MTPGVVLSRHRLPRFYRVSLTALWLMPIALLFSALIHNYGLTTTLLDPRLLLPIGLMMLPAVHIWRQGVDIHHNGIVIRVHLPNTYPYDELKDWRVKQHPQGSILTISRHDDIVVLSYHTAHLTDWPLLRTALNAHIDYSSR